MSSQAWEDYAVPGSPYFVLVDGAIRGEGVATTWPALSSLVADAIARAPSGSGSGGSARALTVEHTLAASGIGPDHPSLYPGASRRNDRVAGVRGGRRRRRARGVVALRRVDARKHHSAR